MQSDSDEGYCLQKVQESLENIENKVIDSSQVITKGSVAAAGINVDTPIVSAIIGNLTGTLPTQKNYAKQVICNVCNCSLSSNIIYQKHISGAKHKKKLKDLEIFIKLNDEEDSRIQKSPKNQSFPFMCEICPLEVNSAMQLQNHLAGERHKKKAHVLKLLQFDKTPGKKSDKPVLGKKTNQVTVPEQKMKKIERDVFVCYICNVLLNSKTQQIEHMKSKRHRTKEELRQRLKHSVDEKNPVKILVVH